MPDRRILVTGASGLIGRNVVKALLEDGAEVHAVARTLGHEPREGEARWRKANLLDHRDRTALLDSVQPETIVHCAWVTTHGAYWTSPENLDWAAATLSFAREARERGVSRFVGVGSCAEYAWGRDEPLSETKTPLAPTTLYGVAKDAARRVLEAYGQAAGLSVAWTRVALLYGAGEHKDRLVASIARSLVRGEPAQMSSGSALRDLLDARDVGAAIAAVATSNLVGAVNIGSGEGVTLLHVGETLARLAHRPDLLRPGALPDRPTEPRRLVMDTTRLAAKTLFKPRVRLEQGLADALAYWRGEAKS